ncbi:MAG: tetratricopeptide repeat protein [Candidatus Omnitrophota bacterium]
MAKPEGSGLASESQSHKPEEETQDIKGKKEEFSTEQKETIIQPPVSQASTRESIIDRRQLDTWRKKVLGQDQTQIKKQEASQSVEAAKSGEKISEEESAEEILTENSKEKTSLAKSEEETSGAGSEEIAKDVAKRTPRTELLNKYGDPQSQQNNLRTQYRSDIPKESKIFKIFGSETAKVNFPVKLLSEEEAKREALKDARPNQFMLVGLAEGTVGYLNAKGNISNLESSQNAPFEESFYNDGSAKLYLKGLIKGEYLLTAKLDTDKEKDNRHIFEYVNPEKYYPIYGDNSSYFNETETSGKFYARIDKDNSYGMWGNYNTQEFTKSEFTRYNRTLAGAKTHIELEDWVKPEGWSPTTSLAKPEGNGLASDGQSHKDKDKMAVKPTIDFFYAPSTQEQVSETFSAKGISGPFWLNKTPLLEYAESIRIETHDRNRSDVVLYTKTLYRDIDYEIDYDSGRIFFKEPIPTRDENDDLNFIIVDYEFVPLNGENKNYLTGTRLQAKMFDNKVTLGGQFISEKHISNSPQLFGTDVVFQPDLTTRLAAEWGHSDNYLDSSNVSIKEDNAWKVEGSKTLGKLRMQGYYSDIGNSFRNPVNVTEKGIEKYGFTADYKLSDATSVVLDHWRNLSTISETFDRQTSLDLYHEKGNYFLGAGYAFQEYKDIKKLTPDSDANIASLKGGLRLTPNLIASLEQEFQIQGESGATDPTDNKVSTTIGRLDYKLSNDATVYVKDRFVKELHKQYEHIQSLGFSRRTPEGESYVEYGFGGETAETIFGLRNEQKLSERLTLSSYMNNRISKDKNDENIGFGSKYEMVEGLFTTFNIENTRSKDSAADTYKQNAQSIAFDYLPKATENSYGLKFERSKASSTNINALGYGKHYLNKDFSLIFNSEYLTEHSGDNTLHTEKKAVAGLAYRPVKNDKLNILSKYEYKDELDNTTTSSTFDYFTHTASLEATYELNPKVDIFGKYALKFQQERENGLDTNTLIDMVTSKLTYKVTDIFDLTGYYRIINDRGSQVIKQAPALEVGVLFFKQLRMAMGYNFLDYQDKTAEEEDYSGGGPYFNFSLKFDGRTPEEIELARQIQLEQRIKAWAWELVNKELSISDSPVMQELDRLYNLAKELEEKGQFEQAKKCYEKTLQIGRMMYAKAEEYVRARVELEKKLKEENVAALNSYKEGRLQEAKELWEKILKEAEPKPIRLEIEK